MTQIVSSVEVVRIPELPELLVKPDSGYIVFFNPADQKTYKILESLLTGGQSTVPNWTPSASFDIGELCIFNLKIWSSKTNANTGNTPIEGAFWEEVSKSLAGYTPLWSAGVFDIARSEVMVLDTGTDKYNLYILRAAAPFPSSNFATELAAGNWQLVGGTGGGGTFEVATNGDMDTGTNDTKGVTPLKFVYGITTRVFSGLNTVNKTIQGAINWLQSLTVILKEATGFRYPDQVIVTYNGTARTITLTGNPEAYYRGNQISALVSGWVSAPHAVGDGLYFLYHDGSDFVWANSPWSFDVIMIAIAYRDGANFCLRECHGLMQWQSHQEFHETLGTYLFSGGDIGAIVLNSTTAANRRPTLSAALIKDEDLPTILPILAAGAYSQLYLSGANTANLVTDQADILPLNVNTPFYNQFTGGAWQQTPFSNNAYGKVFIMAVPVTADVDCQKRRFVFIQPQTIDSTLATIQAVTISSINIGHISSALAEYVFIGEIIVRFTANNWQVISTAKLTGTRVLQGSITGGGGGTMLADNVLLTPPAGYTSIDVQAFATEVAGKLSDHITDTIDAHDASAISVLASGDLTVINQQQVNDALSVTPSELSIVANVATIDLSVSRSYGLVQLSAPTQIDINLLTRKDQRTATLALYPQGNAVTFNANLVNAGIGTIDTSKQNNLLFGALGAVMMYKILNTASYSDPQLFAPVVSMASLSESSLRVSWADTPDNIDTEIRISADGIIFGSPISLGSNAVLYDITGLSVGITRYAQVRFIGDGAVHITSNWSNIASATTSSNLAPTASAVTLVCTPSDWQEGNVLTGSYIYADAEGNAQDVSATGSTFEIKAYDSIALANADTTNTSGTSMINGYTGGSLIPQLSYGITSAHIGKYPKMWVKPKAIGGTLAGVWTGSNIGNQIVPAALLFTDITWDAANKTTNLQISGASLVGSSDSGQAYGVATNILNANQYAVFRNTGSGILAIDDNNTLESYTGFKFGVQRSSVNIFAYQLGVATDTGHVCSDNDIYRIGINTIEYSSNLGANWTVIFSGNTNLDGVSQLYVKGWIWPAQSVLSINNCQYM